MEEIRKPLSIPKARCRLGKDLRRSNRPQADVGMETAYHNKNKTNSRNNYKGHMDKTNGGGIRGGRWG